VVKLAPDGSFVTDYPGEVVVGAAPAPWLCVRAVWDNRLVVLDGLAFHPGDVLLEYFSPSAWFNAFAVHAPDGARRGWYANVTHPARFDPAANPPTLTWHDLFVDVVAVPGAPPVVRDEDELAASGLAAIDPHLHAAIGCGRDAILAGLAAGAFPFGGRR
jgi:uncharacterized protein